MNKTQKIYGRFWYKNRSHRNFFRYISEADVGLEINEKIENQWPTFDQRFRISDPKSIKIYGVYFACKRIFFCFIFFKPVSLLFTNRIDNVTTLNKLKLTITSDCKINTSFLVSTLKIFLSDQAEDNLSELRCYIKLGWRIVFHRTRDKEPSRFSWFIIQY